MSEEHTNLVSPTPGEPTGSPAPRPPARTPGPKPADPGAGEPAADSTPGGEGAPGGAAAGDAGDAAAAEAARKRRRRGSRGGRNRRKPSGTANAPGVEGAEATTSGPGGNVGAGGAASRGSGSGQARAAGTGANPRPPANRRPAPTIAETEREHGADEESDAVADRGLTTEDLALDAKEDAGLAPETRPQVGDTRPVASTKPQIGDTRPAPAGAAENGNGASADESADGTRSGSRRRRRGGRGRGKSGAGTGSGSAGTAAGGGNRGGGGGPRPATEVVRADLGIDDDAVDLELDEDALERRRGRTRKGRPAGRYFMAVHVRDDGHTHIAVLEGRSLVEHYVTTPRDDDMSIDGNIYLGRVQNVLPGMEAAFVDIGTPKNGVLYRGDVSFDPGEVESKQPRIEQLLKNGQNILVQVTKNPIGAKGARLTQEVSLAGRFVVLVPNQPQTYGISKRMPDDERKRLRKVLDHLRPPDAGIIVRTAAEGATAEELERDVLRLRQQWDQISAIAKQSKTARLLYQEPPLALRLLREEFTKEYRGVAIDDQGLYDEVKGYVEAVAPELADRVELYDAEDEGLPVFERYHVHEQLLKALDRKVWLPSGGSLIIERTEALTVIDVNTGKNVGRSNLEETVFKNNVEAAEEVARQLRLRDIGGIIVIDFIDMESKSNRDEVQRAFRAALARDKTRTQVFDISELGLVEMTRKRVSEGLLESVSTVCEACTGRGFTIDQTLLRDLD
ncbi:MAG: Rne/Rng family ribonuclease [Acidimicrobiia bacterium]|jgi:ribonuclease E